MRSEKEIRAALETSREDLKRPGLKEYIERYAAHIASLEWVLEE